MDTDNHVERQMGSLEVGHTGWSVETNATNLSHQTCRVADHQELAIEFDRD